LSEGQLRSFDLTCAKARLCWIAKCKQQFDRICDFIVAVDAGRGYLGSEQRDDLIRKLSLTRRTFLRRNIPKRLDHCIEQMPR